MEEVKCFNLVGEDRILTGIGYLEFKDLKNHAVILDSTGQSEIVNVIECGERPDAPILGETIPHENLKTNQNDLVHDIESTCYEFKFIPYSKKYCK